MTLLRTVIWFAALPLSLAAGGAAGVSATEGQAASTGTPWQLAQAPRVREAEDEGEERRRRGGREESQRGEKRGDRPERSQSRKDDGPQRSGRQQEPRPAAKPSADKDRERTDKARSPARQATPAEEKAPRIEARPPIRPELLKRETLEKAREAVKAKEKEAADQKKSDPRPGRREASGDRRDDGRDGRDRSSRDERKDARPAQQRDPQPGRREADRRDDGRDGRDRGARDDRRVGQPRRIEDIQRLRRQRVEGGRTIIEEPDKRVIVREKGRTIIRHDEEERFRRRFRDARTERLRDGGRRTIFIGPGGVEIITEYDPHDRLLRRYRRHRDGRIVVLIDNRRHHRPSLGGLIIGALLDLPPPVVRIPREKYIVEYEDASFEDIYEALSAPPLEELERDYSLDEIRYNYALRARMRRIDLNTINFDLGSWEVTPDQYPKLERIARAINRLLERNPDEIILVEGHTDAVGPEDLNLTLSDRRAEEVAAILSEEFGVPPENLVTQGYGEQFLKIDTQEPERANRRVAVLRITPLLSRAGP